MKSIEELRKQFWSMEWTPTNIENWIKQIQQDAIQSSENYQKGYLDACEECMKVATFSIVSSAIIKDLKSHLESKRKEFGL